MILRLYNADARCARLRYKTSFDTSKLSSDEQNMYLCLVGLCVFGALAFILFCMTICMCEQISIAIGIIEVQP